MILRRTDWTGVKEMTPRGSAEMASADRRAVMIVEDESIVAHDLQRRLIDLGYDAFAVAASAAVATPRARDKRPDIALVDVRTKGRLDGIKAAERLKERWGVPIVYLTVHADDAMLQRALQTHPHDYLVKPGEPTELRRTIEIALSRHAEREQGPEASSAGSPAPTLPRVIRTPGARAVRRQLERILGSPDFDAPRRSRDFLGFVVEETLAGRDEAITQDAIAVQVFGRKDDFDAMLDPIVRIQAGRLRRSLERYYLLAGREDPIRVQLPKGTYVPAFQAVDPPEAASVRSVPAERMPSVGPAANGWPAVVVSGFEVAGTISALADLAQAVTEELALELGRYGTVRVLRRGDVGAQELSATHGGPRFALEGRLRPNGEGLRITARLVDRAAGEQLWGDEYQTAPRTQQWSGSPEDVARVVAARVAAEEGVVVQLLSAERRKRRLVEPTSYDAILLSYEFFLARNAQAFRPAVAALRSVVEAAPESGPAWTALARLYLANYAFELGLVPASIDEAIACAHQGVRVDPASRSARCILAAALLVKGELAAGRRELDQALQASPGSLVYLEIIGFLLTLLGDWERGQAVSSGALERNPHCLPHVLFGIWADRLRRGDVEQAYQAALDYRDPTFFWRAVMRASCLGLLGRVGEARREVAEILSSKPDFPARGRALIGCYIKFPEVMGQVVDGLAKAGLPLA